MLVSGKDVVKKGSLLFCNVFPLGDVAYDDPFHIVIVIKINWGPVFLELK
jgi:hypothetical protein